MDNFIGQIVNYALDAYEQRHYAHSANIHNISNDLPERFELVFEEKINASEFQDALSRRDGGFLKQYIENNPLEASEYHHESDDVDRRGPTRELLELRKNSMKYEVLIQAYKQYSSMKSAVITESI